MSTTEGRRQRMQRILKELRKNPRGLNAHQIANKTEVLLEVTMDRLYKYLAELEWSDMIINRNGVYSLFLESSSKTREREKSKKRGKK